MTEPVLIARRYDIHHAETGERLHSVFCRTAERAVEQARAYLLTANGTPPLRVLRWIPATAAYVDSTGALWEPDGDGLQRIGQSSERA